MEIHENLFQGKEEDEESLADPLFAPFEPINDLVLVKLWEEKSHGVLSKEFGIVSADKYKQRSNQAIIVAVGDKVTARVQAGDRILLGIGNVEDVNVNGENLLLIREGDIRGFERKL